MKQSFKKAFFAAIILGVVFGLVVGRLTFTTEICDAKAGIGNSLITDCIIGGTNDFGFLKMAGNLFNRLVLFSVIAVLISTGVVGLFYLIDRKRTA